LQGEKDDKIIAVCADDPEYRHYNDISELSPHRLQEIRRFFEDCTRLLSLYIYLAAPWCSLGFRAVLAGSDAPPFNWPCGCFVSCSGQIPDKKNENKEVAVNDFLPAAAAREAIQYSM
jgi:inorganic pyrophosphatase